MTYRFVSVMLISYAHTSAMLYLSVELQLQFLRIKKHSPCALIEGEKEQTVTAWEHLIM
jgi:hypothetical protein